MPAESGTWYLTIRKGPKAGSAYPLPGGTITIGRRADNHIVIDDPMVSRHHARLTWHGNTFSIEDLGSANGVWVNNIRITSPVSLRLGDVIGLSQELLLGFSDRLQADATMYDASAGSGMAPLSAPVAVPASPPQAVATAGRSQGWLAFGLGGVMAVLAVVALAAAGLAAYLLIRKPPEDLGSQAVLPPSSPTPIPTGTPYPTYTPVPTVVPTATPYPTYTPVPTEVPTATPYPTYTPFPTPAPTATPYPTYTPYPTATPMPRAPQSQPQQPTNTPIPAATALPAYTVTLGRNVTYEPWGRPMDPGGCKGPYDDESPVRRFTVEIILTNNSNRFIPDHWSPVFISASGRPIPTCIWYYNNTVVQPGEIINVTFATHLESNDWVSALLFEELGYPLTICLSPSGQMISCQ